MTSSSAAASSRDWPADLPRSWLAIVWVAMVAYSVLAPQVSDPTRVAIGVLMGVAAVAVLFTTDEVPPPYRLASVLIATVCGLVTIVLSSEALGYVPVLMVAPRFPYLTRRPLMIWTVVDTIAFGAAVAITARHITPAIAGIGIPLTVQRGVQRRQLIAERDRAQALLLEVQAGREAEAQAAALRERGRIARDMHDVLAHSLAGLSLQLQAIRAVAAHNNAAPELTEPIERAAALARDGLAEAREAVSTLRDPSDVGVDALPTLVARQPGAARIEITGTPTELPHGVGRIVYRAVQEALTNTARYAPGGTVTVTVTWTPSRLGVVIDDTGPAVGHEASPGQGSGLGLAGMDERVRAVGGTLRAGPRSDGPGWRVALSVPTGAEDAA